MKTNSVLAWILAARPKTLTGAIAPVLVGGAMAFSLSCQHIISKNIDMYGRLNLSDTFLQTRLVSVLVPFVLCLLFAVLMQIDANFINDYFDFRKGTDREDRLGPERACAQGWITPRAMQWGIAVMTLLSCGVGLLLLLWHLQWELLLVGILCVLFCFLYTTRLSYLGWGDLLVFIFFGVVPVVFTAYVMLGCNPTSFMESGLMGASLVVAGLAMGLATDNLLMVNNYRDRHQDLISGKRTLIVRIIEAQKHKFGSAMGQRRGERISLNLYLWLGIIAFFLAFFALSLFPLSNLLPSARALASAAPDMETFSFSFFRSLPLMLIYLILHIRAFFQMRTLDGRALNSVLGATARNIFLFGLLLAVSVFLSSSSQ